MENTLSNYFQTNRTYLFVSIGDSYKDIIISKASRVYLFSRFSFSSQAFSAEILHFTTQ